MTAPHEADDARYARRVGQLLRGKWRLDALLGVGGMASVYAATHRNAKRGAVKLLHAELAGDEAARSRFLREGYVANRVGHPGVVNVLDDDVTEHGDVYLVMELLDGVPLDAYANRKPGARLPIGEVVALAINLLDVLAAAHEKDIIHRDLKPENVFITRGGQLKVLDFGIARLRETQNAATATRTGDPMGTPAFMSPEQAAGEWDQVDRRSDLWAVGATMFTLATGRLVHAEDTVSRVLIAAMTKPAPRIAALLPACPPAVAHVIDRALAFGKNDRWPNASAMQAALRAAASKMPGVALPVLGPGPQLAAGTSGLIRAPIDPGRPVHAPAPPPPGVPAAPTQVSAIAPRAQFDGPPPTPRVSDEPTPMRRGFTDPMPPRVDEAAEAALRLRGGSTVAAVVYKGPAPASTRALYIAVGLLGALTLAAGVLLIVIKLGLVDLSSGTKDPGRSTPDGAAPSTTKR